jgi:hypothetical protein
MSHNSLVKTLDGVRSEIKTYRGSGKTYAEISTLYDDVGKGNVWNVEHGVEPKSPRVRSKFGLSVKVTPAMYYETKTCSVEGCDVPFIPNSPLRTKCFHCSPYKGKERR